MYKYFSEVEQLIDEMASTYLIKEKSLTFYKGRITNFFSEYMDSPENENKPLKALTYFDINRFLETLGRSDAEKLNYYSALKRFFEYTYLKGKTNEIISQVTKPKYKRKEQEVLNDDEYLKLKKFIFSRDNDLDDRLILGLFIFTGLSRQYIANLRNNQFLFEYGVYSLIIWKEGKEIRLPLKAELQILINEYFINLSECDKLEKVIKIQENHVSNYISDLVNRIIGRKCTPTILSNTFIHKALISGNYIWEISKLTLESVTTIEKHIINTEGLFNKQTAILNSF